MRQRGLPQVRGACHRGTERPLRPLRRAGRPEPARSTGEPVMGRLTGSRAGEGHPDEDWLTAASPA